MRLYRGKEWAIICLGGHGHLMLFIEEMACLIFCVRLLILFSLFIQDLPIFSQMLSICLSPKLPMPPPLTQQIIVHP